MKNACFFGGNVEVVVKTVGLVLSDESLRSRIVDVEDGGRLHHEKSTSLIEKPS